MRSGVRVVMIKLIDNVDFDSTIFHLISNAYAPSLLEGTIYETSACIPIIRKQILDNQYYGFMDGEELEGVIQVRGLNEMLFLNQIAVRKSSRGIGTTLLEYFLSLAEELNLRASLEVDDRNTRVLHWYKSKGFTSVSQSFKALYVPLKDSERKFKEASFTSCEGEIGYSKLRANNNEYVIPTPSTKSFVFDLDTIDSRYIQYISDTQSQRKIFVITKQSKNIAKYKGYWTIHFMIHKSKQGGK